MKELVKIKCFNAKQLAEAKAEYKSYNLVPVNKNGYKFVIVEAWVEADNLFSNENETKTTTASEEQFY